MTKLGYKVLLMVCLVGLSFSASADDRNRDGGWQGDRDDRWKLGAYRGGSRGSEILRWDGRRWRVMPGRANDVGNGWVIGTDRRGGGYGIYRWNGRGWERVPGGAVKVGGTYSQPWVINNRNEKFFWNGRDWDSARHSGRRVIADHYSNSFRQRERRDEPRRDNRRRH